MTVFSSVIFASVWYEITVVTFKIWLFVGRFLTIFKTENPFLSHDG